MPYLSHGRGSETVSDLVEIVVDIHEKDSEVFEAIGYRKLGVCKMASLETGDIILRYKFYTIGIEVKRGVDFQNSLKSGRLHNQLARLTEGFDFPILIIEDWHPYIAPDDDKETIAEKVRLHEMTVRTLNRRVCTYETPHLEATVDLIAELVRDLKANKLNVIRRPVTVEEEMTDDMVVICSLPNVKRFLGERILDKYGTVEKALADVDNWTDIDGIGKVKLARIKRTLEEEFDG